MEIAEQTPGVPARITVSSANLLITPVQPTACLSVRVPSKGLSIINRTGSYADIFSSEWHTRVQQLWVNVWTVAIGILTRNFFHFRQTLGIYLTTF
jgi:hypothetical protein